MSKKTPKSTGKNPAAAIPVPPASLGSKGPRGGKPHSLEELDAMGKAIRDRLPRADHGIWKKPADRADPIAMLRASDADRLKELVPIRYGRMLASPFTFFRGSAGVMAADLAKTPTTGHHVQACGDCHLMNFGGFATPERNIIFDINDFDETLPAPWEWDVKRLVASFVLAARSNGLSDSAARDIAAACARSYRTRIRRLATMPPLEVWYEKMSADDFIDLMPRRQQKAARDRIEKATGQAGSEMDFPKLAGVVGGHAGIRDTPPLIFHPETSRLPEFENVIRDTLDAYRATLTDDRKVLLDRYRFVDAAIKVVGIGSVGRRCWIALFMSVSNDPLFLQFKEAVPSVLEPYAGASVYAHPGERVVTGQRLMQPVSDLFLGWVTATGGERKHYYVRQLRDAKIKPLVETFDEELMTVYAKGCGAVLARAHAKASNVAEIGGYLGNSESFDEAMGNFAIAYADQAERDHGLLKAAVRKGQVQVYREEG